MKQVLFATGNSRKIVEANHTLTSFGIEVLPRRVEIEEIQHRDPIEVTKAKAVAAYRVTGEPVVVSDTSWSIPALGGFPGAYMKDIAAWLAPEDWVGIMKRHKDRRIFCHEHVAYYEGTLLRHFQADYEGRFIDTPRGRNHDEESFEKLVILYGNKTMAEQLADGDIASAGEDLRHWTLFARWFSQKDTA